MRSASSALVVSSGLVISMTLVCACESEGTGTGGSEANSGGASSSTAVSGGGGAGGTPATSSASGGGGEGGANVNGAQFFSNATLHTIDIEVDPQYLDTLDNTSVRVPATITYDGEVVTQAGIRKKGQSTMRPLADKPSFSIKLDEEIPGQDIDGIEKFNVHNTVMDPSFSSESLTYLLYERAGVPAPRTAHAELRFNGETKGFYVVVEAINKQFLQEHYGDGEGNLYEGPWDFTQDPAAAELKDIEEGRTNDDLVALTDAVLGATPDTLDDAISPLIDVDQLLTTFALDMSFCLWDGYTVAAWNFYLYHVPSSVPNGGRFVMLPHGADWPYWVADLDPMNPDFRPWGAEFPAGFLAIQLTSPPFVGRYQNALAAVRDQFDVAVLSERIDTIEANLHSASSADPVLADELSAFDADVQTPRDFVVARRAYLDGLTL